MLVYLSYQISDQRDGFSLSKVRHAVNTVKCTSHPEKGWQATTCKFLKKKKTKKQKKNLSGKCFNVAPQTHKAMTQYFLFIFN